MTRLQKYLSECGVASRREAERWIVEGRISVNGKVVTELGFKVNPPADRVMVDGSPVRPKKKLYVALNKPPGFLTTRRDPEDRRTVFDLLPAEWDKLYPVGRLDRDSEGLLFLTNDGDFALQLTHPRYGVKKWYRAVVEGRVEAGMLRRMKEGLEHDGEMLKALATRLVSANQSHSVVELEMGEGKNREVRRLFEACGLEVVRLIRTQVGRIRLGELKPGKWRTLTEPEIKSLLSRT